MVGTISPSMEDYLESIFIIQQKRKVVRVKDIVEFNKVKAPSVIEALSKLQGKGLVFHERYGYIELTRQGSIIAKDVYKKHKMLKKFFHNILGIKEKFAEEDACKIEHYLSQETINRMVSFIKFVETCPKKEGPQWLKSFYHYNKTGKHLENKKK